MCSSGCRTCIALAAAEAVDVAAPPSFRYRDCIISYRLKLVKSSHKAGVDLKATNLVVQRRIASAMLVDAHSSLEDKTRRLSPEEENILVKWDERLNVEHHALSSILEQLEVERYERPAGRHV